MIKYKIFTTKGCTNWASRAYINIDEKSIKWAKEYMFLTEEINNLSADKKYLNEIVQELEEVVAWTRDICQFWFETTIISVVKKWFIAPNWKIFPNWDVSIAYNYWDNEITTDLKAEEILKMMRDWRDYINAWEKETGKIKN